MIPACIIIEWTDKTHSRMISLGSYIVEEPLVSSGKLSLIAMHIGNHKSTKFNCGLRISEVLIETSKGKNIA